ncbi:MAG: FUSC family protein, partial [Flavobacteriales bacterium]|nr:FUSC family protein [Flavobacteriales bacterium]
MFQIKNIKEITIRKFKRGRYVYGLQGLVTMLASYFVTLQFADATEALISGLIGLFMFIEHKNFGFKRRIAQSLMFVGIQIIILIILSVFFSDHYYLALPFNLILFFSLNYYNYFDTPNTITLTSIQYFYLISVTTPIDVEQLPIRIYAVLVGIGFTAIGLLVFWPTKTHRNLEKKLQVYLSNTRKILEFDIEEYNSISKDFKKAQNVRFSEIMDVLYSLKYGNIFSTTKGKILFKIAVNTQILNNSLHGLKRSKTLSKHKGEEGFFEISELWKSKLIDVVKLLEQTVVEDKHALLLIEEEYRKLNKLTSEWRILIDSKNADKFSLRISEIDYLTNTLIDFSKKLILFKHKVEEKGEKNKFDFLYRFDNFRNNILGSLNLKQPSVRFALHTSLLISISLFLVAYFDVFEGFWIPMTILLIMKPNNGGTKKQTLNRIGGTVVGLIISFLVISFLPREAIAPIIILSTYMTVVMIKDEYGIAVIFITMIVVLLMAFDFELTDLLVSRLLFTSATAVLVLISSSLLLPNWSKNDIRNKMKETLKSDLIVLKNILDKADSKSVNKDVVRLSMINSYQGRKQIKELYTQMQSEPKSQQLNLTIGKQFLIAHERFSHNYGRFVYAILTKKTKIDLPFWLIQKSFVTAIKNIIYNLDKAKKDVKSNGEALSKLFAFLVNIEVREDLNDEQYLMVSDLKKTTKR